jgi:hypothetical protein
MQRCRVSAFGVNDRLQLAPCVSHLGWSNRRAEASDGADLLCGDFYSVSVCCSSRVVSHANSLTADVSLDG